MPMNNQSNNEKNSGDSVKTDSGQSENIGTNVDKRPLFTYLGKMPELRPLNYSTVMVATLGTGVLTLVILPLGAFWIASSTDCCFTDSSSNLLSFWAAILGGFIALFGMVISGLFVAISFRIDSAAKSEAIKAANEILGAYLQANEGKVVENFRTIVRISEKRIGDSVKETEQKAKDAQEKIAETTSNVEEAGKKAIVDIAKFTAQVEQAQKRTEKQIQQAAAQVEDARNGAASQISALVAEVEQERNEALRRMQPPEDDETSGA